MSDTTLIAHSHTTEHSTELFDGCLATFVDGCDRIINRDSTGGLVRKLDTMLGHRYVRVVRTDYGSRSVHCFVDRTNGDVLKADGWKRPAKHARGNIFDQHNGLGSMGPYGPAYLR
jgi:hypothetical protein